MNGNGLSIVKRDGSKENLNLDKIHKMVEAACDGINGVSASQVEMSANLSFYEGVTTQEIQDTLIKSASDLISLDTPNYQYVAARLLLFAIRKGRELMNSDPVSNIVKKEIAPGSELNTDEELLDWVRNNAETTYHPVGTCKMGNDPMAVVDYELKVHGIKQLRIADASIMPTLTSGNTNAPCIMIGEKCAAMVLRDAEL